MIVLKRTTDPMRVAELNRPVQTLHHQLYPDLFVAYDKEAMADYFEMTINDSNCHFIIAYEDEMPVGYVYFEEIIKPEDAIQRKTHKLYVHQLSVNELYQRKGIGNALMAYVKTYAVNQNAQSIELEYWIKNEQAGLFYKKQGFENREEKVSCVICKAAIHLDEAGQLNEK